MVARIEIELISKVTVGRFSQLNWLCKTNVNILINSNVISNAIHTLNKQLTSWSPRLDIQVKV